MSTADTGQLMIVIDALQDNRKVKYTGDGNTKKKDAWDITRTYIQANWVQNTPNRIETT